MKSYTLLLPLPLSPEYSYFSSVACTLLSIGMGFGVEVMSYTVLVIK
jgi:hypothetical protein